MIRISPLVLVLFLAAPGFAQDAKPPAEPPSEPPAKAVPAERAPGASEEQVDLSEAHWFRVKLNTGESLLGLARPGRLWEVQIRGSRWDPVEKDAEASGIRLWYVKRQLGFVFVPSKDIIGKPRDLGQATAADAQKIREDRERAKRRAEESRQRAIEHTKRMRERLAARRKGGDAEGEAAAEADPMDSLSGAQQALLRKYPPDKWTPNTPDKIRHRFTILGIPAKDNEKAFLEVFDKWKNAWDALEAAKEKIEEAKKAKEAAAAAAAAAAPSAKPGGEGGEPEPKPEGADPNKYDAGDK